mgnify:CR=1 FL=1
MKSSNEPKPRWLSLLLMYSRPLAYASELGESLRKLIPQLVRPLYCISFFYVFMDMSLKYKFYVGKKSVDYKKAYMKDLFLWHMGASIIFPAIFINRFVHYTSIFFKKTTIPFRKFLPTLFALSLIPFIIHPLDDLTDYIMDNSYRKYSDYNKYDSKIKIK